MVGKQNWECSLRQFCKNQIMNFDYHQFISKTSELFEANQSFATVTLVAIRGSAPQVVGAKAIVTSDGIEGGTVGGGKIEAAAVEHAKSLLSQNQRQQICELVTWNLQTDIGMTCGGEVQLMFEVVRNDAWPIAVFGAGHIAQQLVPLLLTLNCRVTWIDPRLDWLSKIDEHRKLKKVCTDNMPAEVTRQPDKTFFVLMTRGHASDLPVLSEILRTRQAPYVGVIGSKQKASVLRRDLKQQGLDNELIGSFHCPMGQAVGNNTPAEIAVSVVSQLLQVRDKLGLFSHKSKVF